MPILSILGDPLFDIIVNEQTRTNNRKYIVNILEGFGAILLFSFQDSQDAHNFTLIIFFNLNHFKLTF